MAKKKVEEAEVVAEAAAPEAPSQEAQTSQVPTPPMFSQPPVVRVFKPEEVQINPAFLARKSEPNKKDIEDIASNMVELRDMGQPHQIQNGRVTIREDGVVYLVDGRNRLEAERRLNSLNPDEPFLFFAEVVPASDDQALFTAVSANEFRVPPNVFDQADVAKRLVAQGKTHEEIAKMFRTKSKGYIGDIIRVGELPPKVQKLYPEKCTLEGLIALARYNSDPILQEDLRAAEENAYEARKAAIAEASERSKVRPGEEGKKKGSKSGAPASDAVKRKPQVLKKISGESVKKRAEAVGAKKKSPKADDGKRNYRDLVNFLNGNFGAEVKEEVPEPIVDLAEALESYRDGDLSDLQLRNRFVKCCRSKY